jgi:capsular polysaccharide transport system permease protein
MKPKAPKFHIRRSPVSAPEPANRAPSGEEDAPTLGGPVEDGFGNRAFPGSAKAEANAESESAIAEIRREGLTGRQLRMARRLAQRHGLSPSSDFDAVRLLRDQGIDPFDRNNMIELVHARGPEGEPGAAGQPPTGAEKVAAIAAAAEAAARAGGAVAAPDGGEGAGGKPPLKAGLPQTVDPQKNLPGEHIPRSPAPGLHEIERIQRDIVRRRRRNLFLMGLRVAVFVFLPTILCMLYFAFVATPSFATKSEFVVQQAEVASGTAGLLGGTAMATSQDSIAVQGYLNSREAMQRLDAEHGYRAHFSDPSIDAVQRVASDATNEDLYRQYRNNVKVGYDPTEGVIRMEVSAATPEMSRTFAEALIGYAEERVDQLTERKRADQMKGASETFADAEKKMVEAQEQVLTLQEQLGVLDPQSESASLMSQINALETQLTDKRLALSQLLDNTRPNQARVAGVEGDIARLEKLLGDLRSQITDEGRSDSSLASVSARLRMAEVDLETRTMMMQEALQHLEAARIEANRQVRFLSVSVPPVPPDEPTYPKVFEDTLIAFFVFGALYLLVSVTAAILREQVSS